MYMCVFVFIKVVVLKVNGIFRWIDYLTGFHNVSLCVMWMMGLIEQETKRKREKKKRGNHHYSFFMFIFFRCHYCCCKNFIHAAKIKRSWGFFYFFIPYLSQWIQSTVAPTQFVRCVHGACVLWQIPCKTICFGIWNWIMLKIIVI